jgi:hypothetical protein
VPVSRFAPMLGTSSNAPSPAAASPMPIDMIYESALRLALQIIVER